MKRHLSIMGAVALASFATTAAADEFLKLEPLYKNGNVIVPFYVDIDTDLDGMPDKLKFRFDVFPAGTKTKLLSTKPKVANYPAVPCASPVSGDRDFEIRFAGAGSANRSHMILDLYTECQESGTGEWKESHNTVLYSANVTASGGSWAKVFGNWQVFGTDGVDWDSDGTTELMVLMGKDVSNLTKGRTLFVQMSDGTIESDKVYTVAVEK